MVRIGMIGGSGLDDPQILQDAKELHPPTQETTALAVEECVTLDRNPFSDRSTMLRRISLTGG